MQAVTTAGIALAPSPRQPRGLRLIAALDVLRRHAPALRARGVNHSGIFGRAVRGVFSGVDVDVAVHGMLAANVLRAVDDESIYAF